jgi:recombinational DNA repair protein RecR
MACKDKTWLESNAVLMLILSLDQIESVGMKSAVRKAHPILALSKDENLQWPNT